MTILRAVWCRRWTVLLSALALTVWALPGAADALAFDWQAAPAAGVGALTGHFTHWSRDHLFWDLSMFVVLAALLEPRGRLRLLACIGLCAMAISATVRVGQPELASYRGLSGIDSGLFVLAVASLGREARTHGDTLLFWLLAALSVGFLGKIGFEFATGGTVFVDSAPFTAVPLAHVVGAACGGLLALWPQPKRAVVRKSA